MKTRLLRVWIAAPLLIAAATSCGSSNGPSPAAPSRPPAPRASAPPSVAEQVGEGPMAVYGANVYSPGQKIFKELRQEDSLMAFLACQGEPDRVEVVDNAGEAPRILLEYSRGGVAQRGTVEIAPSPAGYYAAQPIDPNGRLKRSGSADAPRRTAPPPKRPPKPAPEPPAESPPPPAPEAVEDPAQSALPQPTAGQLDECPIEPWRADCRKLCGPEADWEWCQYED